MKNYCDYFGFLPINKTIEWECGQAIPVNNLDNIIKEIHFETNEDGFYYPPIINTVLLQGSEKIIKPRTRRPALLHQLPSSHKIELSTNIEIEDFKKYDGAFLIHFIGFIFGYRLQFENWWHDGRISMDGRKWSIIKNGIEKKLISTAYTSWLNWSTKEKERFINILYMHCRSDTYEWDWERFNNNYMVFDACYKMLVSIKKFEEFPSHKNRFKFILNHFSIQFDKVLINEIVDIRNDLLHEVSWDKSMPCIDTNKGGYHSNNLKRINDRLIMALAGLKNEYIKSSWWSISTIDIE